MPFRKFSSISLLLLVLASSPGVARPQELTKISSPRLRSLATELGAGNENALERFWRKLEESGAPLVEPVEGEPDHVWLTVIWRGDDDTRNVLLVGGLARNHPLDNTLERLLNTNLWYRTYRTRNDLRASYQFSPNGPLKIVPMDDTEAVRAQRANYQRDPFNPNRYGGASLVELPDAPPQPWIEPNPDAPSGDIRIERAFKSEILENERRIAVYLPPEYDASGPSYPMLLVFDYLSYTISVPTPRILNNLIHANEIPPVVAVFVGNAQNARNVELTCNDDFVAFLATELIPWVSDRYNVSADPSKNVVAGSSFGGLASSYLAFRHPELFGNVISQSGSYWWSPETNTDFLPYGVEGEWLTRRFAESERKPVRFFVESGLNEIGNPSMVVVNRHFRDILTAKGYEIVAYNEFNGGHEYLNWRGSLADALIAILGN